jgi:hypothetical protein
MCRVNLTPFRFPEEEIPCSHCLPQLPPSQLLSKRSPLISGMEVMPYWETMIFETQKRTNHDALTFNMLILQYKKGFYFESSLSIDK